MKKLERYNVDFVISCGAACRPAHYTQELGLRKFSSPCDWMYNYSLDDFIEVMQTEGTLMFQECAATGQPNSIEDTRTGMISMHDFKTAFPLEEQLPGFYEKMNRRAKNTNAQLQACFHAGLIMNRQVTREELMAFCETVCKMYPGCSFNVLNIWDNPDASSAKIDFQETKEKYTLTQISFNDAHKNGRMPSENPHFWYGNEVMWKKVLLAAFAVKGSWKVRARKAWKKTVSLAKACLSKCLSKLLFIKKRG